MGRHLPPRLALAALLVFAAGCGGVGTAQKDAFASLSRADRLTVYEGLPHQGNEKDAHEQERKSKPTIDLHGYAFYRGPLAVSVGDSAKLAKELGDSHHFTPFVAEKKCGGFHPDYAIEWTSGGKLYHCLLCFGCSEAKFFGPGGESRFDMTHGFDKVPFELLNPYRKNRPAPVYGRYPG